MPETAAELVRHPGITEEHARKIFFMTRSSMRTRRAWVCAVILERVSRPSSSAAMACDTAISTSTS